MPEAGDSATEVTVGVDGVAITVTVTDDDCDVSATLVAVTVSVPVVAGAVYTPAAVIVPRVAFQVTAVLVLPCMVALNGSELPTIAWGAAGEIVIDVSCADALPCSGTTTGLALALVISVSCPSTLPDKAASKVTAKLWLCPGAIDIGALNPVIPKPVPDTCTWLRLKAAVPVLLAVMFCELGAPNEEFIVTLAGFSEICGVAVPPGGVTALLTDPAQPEFVSAAPKVAARNTNSAPCALRERCMSWTSPQTR